MSIRQRKIISLDCNFKLISLTQIVTTYARPPVYCSVCQTLLSHQSYYMHSRQLHNYCITCATNHILNSKNFKILPYLTEQESLKKRESDSFLNRLDLTLKMVQEDEEKLSLNNVQYKKNHEKNLDFISVYFRQMSQMMNKTCQKIIEERNKQYISNIEQIRKEKEALKNIRTQILKLNSDIGQNYDKIVLGMEATAFHQVMGQCYSSLQKIQKASMSSYTRPLGGNGMCMDSLSSNIEICSKLGIKMNSFFEKITVLMSMSSSVQKESGHNQSKPIMDILCQNFDLEEHSVLSDIKSKETDIRRIDREIEGNTITRKLIYLF